MGAHVGAGLAFPEIRDRLAYVDWPRGVLASINLTRACETVYLRDSVRIGPLWVYSKSMPQKMLRTYSAKPGEVDVKWLHVDASDKVLGRLATRIATVLMGKHRPTYTPHVDTGDFVVVTNAGKVRVTGGKADTMVYPRYSYHPGGYKEIPYKRVLERHPERIIEEAVRRMLPKSALGRQMLKKLKVYAAETHPHTAQQPVPLTL